MGRPDLICFSHLRWDFVYQRPQHLLSRAARDRRVFFVEEPELGSLAPRLAIRTAPEAVTVVRPQLPAGIDNAAITGVLRGLLDELVSAHALTDYVAWYYTPMALPFSRHLSPRACVYDCMDELSGFHGAPPNLLQLEAQLMAGTDLVFTGGHSLYRAKRDRHPSVHAFPSSVDAAHFARARTSSDDPADQADIPHPRAGFFGVIDERMDLALVEGLADLRPELQLVMIGPVVKIDPATLPQRRNLHWLGGKSYAELPDYIGGWDVAIMPFARNAATRFISPTKTPEYLAAGRPVVSTSIADVIDPYGALGLARIADTPGEFAAAIDQAMAEDRDERLRAAERWLAQLSWDRTWSAMDELIDAAVETRASERVAS